MMTPIDTRLIRYPAPRHALPSEAERASRGIRRAPWSVRAGLFVRLRARFRVQVG